MRLTIRVLGCEVLLVSTEADNEQQGPGDCTTMPLGFAASPGDQRWREVEGVETR